MSYYKELDKFISKYDTSNIMRAGFSDMSDGDKVALQLIRTIMSFYNRLPGHTIPEEAALWYLASAIIIRSTSGWCLNGVDAQEREIVALLTRFADRPGQGQDP